MSLFDVTSAELLTSPQDELVLSRLEHLIEDGAIFAYFSKVKVLSSELARVRNNDKLALERAFSVNRDRRSKQRAASEELLLLG